MIILVEKHTRYWSNSFSLTPLPSVYHFTRGRPCLCSWKCWHALMYKTATYKTIHVFLSLTCSIKFRFRAVHHSPPSNSVLSSLVHLQLSKWSVTLEVKRFTQWEQKAHEGWWIFLRWPLKLIIFRELWNKSLSVSCGASTLLLNWNRGRWQQMQVWVMDTDKALIVVCEVKSSQISCL